MTKFDCLVVFTPRDIGQYVSTINYMSKILKLTTAFLLSHFPMIKKVRTKI